jgi:glycosidase
MVMFQNTFIGAPMTYYGNEAGMWSPDDPNNRQPLPWNDKGPYQNGVGFNQNVFDGFQRAITIRNHFPVLRHGDYYPVKIDDDANVIAFARSLGDDDVVYVIVNRSDAARELTINVKSGIYLDFADPTSAVVRPADAGDAKARPTLSAKPDAKTFDANEGKLTITVGAFGCAVLSQSKGE